MKRGNYISITCSLLVAAVCFIPSARAEKRILFISAAETGIPAYEMYTMKDDGTDIQRLTTSAAYEWVPAIAPDTNAASAVNLTQGTIVDYECAHPSFYVPSSGTGPFVFSITNLSGTATNVTLTWPTQSSSTYTIQSTTNIVVTNGVNVAGHVNIPGVDGALTRAVDYSEARIYFRVLCSE